MMPLMGLYKYQIITADGLKKSGDIEADSEKSAKRQLQQQGHFVARIYSADGTFSLDTLKNLPLKDILNAEIGTAKIPEVELVAFSRQFATLISADIPVLSALDSLIEGTEHRSLRRILSKIRSDVNEGSSLSEALESHKNVLGDLYVNMVHAAEKSGRLGDVLSELAESMEKRNALIGQVRSALSYPIIMLVVGLGVVAFLLTNVVPNITSMFINSGKELPRMTQIMLSISDFLINYGIVVLAIVAAFIILLQIAIKKSDETAFVWDKIRLKLPIYGPLAHKTAHSRFCGTLSSLLNAGVPMITSLMIAKNVTPYIPYKNAIDDIRKDVNEGRHLGECMKETSLFPALIVNMVTIGEKAGRLEEMLANVSKTIDTDLTTRLGGLSRLIQPLLILVMGGLIAFVMGAVLIPIFELNSLAGGL